MARLAPEDPYCGLADPALLARMFPALDLDDPAEPSAARLTELAAETEDAARAIKGVTNSNGASAGWSSGMKVLATSGGFAGGHRGTSHSIGCSVVAGEGTAMETDYEGSSARHAADLDTPASVGAKAGERAVKRLNPRKLKSITVPVIFDPRIAGGLLGHLAGAINGASIARGVSVLQDRLGKPVFAPGIRIIDDPLRPRGQRSRPFDGEGVAGTKRAMVEDGVLTSWFLDSAAAKQLGLTTTGHAARGTGGPPSPAPTNLYLEAGSRSPEAMIKSLKQGLYVTDLIGMGVNGVTGDYSRGAAGFFIEDGALTYPVSEITVASNLKEMFATLEPASDLVFRYGVNAPTILIASMTIAGT
jgi:PmbA protein